jgi:hypothetical protein
MVSLDALQVIQFLILFARNRYYMVFLFLFYDASLIYYFVFASLTVLSALTLNDIIRDIIFC